MNMATVSSNNMMGNQSNNNGSINSNMINSNPGNMTQQNQVFSPVASKPAYINMFNNFSPGG
jgi:hypothetical protein